ncbi:MAG: methyltransferase protein [Segetibacter sp.]|nr:methyltransferase protein [Segetibacter sp.]
MALYKNTADWLNSRWHQVLNYHENKTKTVFIEALIPHLALPASSKLLEVGAGTGIKSQKLAEQGFDVTGIDYSFEAIRKAKELESETLHFFQHDIRLPFWINYFDAAFTFFPAFGYYNTRREHENSIRVVSQSLKPNGLLVMDYLNVHYEEDHFTEKQEKLMDGAEFVIENRQDDENFFKQIKVKEQGVLNDLFTEKFAKLSLGDFTEMCAYHGLQVEEVFGDYNFAGYHIRTSPRLIFTAKKIKR